MPLTDTNALIDERVEALRRFHRQLGIDRAQLDLSGGVDSAVMLGLLARALGPRNITAVHSMIDTDPAATGRAREVAASCHVPLVEIELSAVFAQLTEGLQRALIAAGAHPTELTERLERDPTILGSIRSTLRAPVGRGANRMSGDGGAGAMGQLAGGRYKQGMRATGKELAEGRRFEPLQRTDPLSGVGFRVVLRPRSFQGLQWPKF